MSLNFQNVSVLSLNQEARFFQAGFQYSNLKKIQIEGNSIDLNVSLGITGTWTGMFAMTRNAYNYQELILNGYSFGTGRLGNLTFDAGNDVQVKKYRAELIVYDSGNLFNFGGTYYTGVDTDNFQYLDQFTENYSFDRKNNGGYSYNHGAQIRFNSGVGNLSAIASAKTLAQSLFTGFSIGFQFYSGFTNKQGKRFFNESYNLIDNSCNFDETFEFDANSGNYSAIRANTFEIEKNGIINVSENGEIRGIENPTYQKAMSALGSELSGSYGRCMNVFNLYAPSGSYALVAEPLTHGTTVNLFDNILRYTSSFSNNRENLNTYLWNFQQEVRRDAGITQIIENGSVQGRGGQRAVAFQNAQNGMLAVATGIGPRIQSIYNGFGGIKPIFNEALQNDYSPYKGIISYQVQYSDEQVIAGNNGIKWMRIKNSSVYPIYRYNTFNAFNQSQFIQNAFTSLPGRKEVELEVNGEKPVSLNVYLSNATTQLNLLTPSFNNCYIQDCKYDYDQNESKANVRITWVYEQIASPSIYP